MRKLRWEKELWRALKNPVELQELSRGVSVTSTQDFGIVVKKADGPFVWDIFGKRYFDFSSSVGVMNLGHKIPEIKGVVMRQIDLVDQVPDHDWPNATATLLKKRLCEITPGKFPKKVFLSNSGTEAVEAAIKLLLADRPERKCFVSFEGAFHGRTGYALALNGSKPVHREHFPKSLEVYKLPFPEKNHVVCDDWREKCTKLFHRLLGRVNAVFIELVQGEGGINVVDYDLVTELRDFLRHRGIKLVVDEVQTGLYRTGAMFACEHYGLEPDILCLGKSLGGDFPLAATVARAELDFDKPGRHSGTFGGSPVPAAAAMTVLELMESLDRGLLSKNYVTLSGFAPEGLGLMRRWRFPDAETRDAFVKEAKARGILLLGAGTKNVRFMPQINIPTQLLEEALQILRSIDIPHL